LTKAYFEQAALIRIILYYKDVRVMRAFLNHDQDREEGSPRGIFVSAAKRRMCHQPRIESEISPSWRCANRILP
jgi:hypothetical protein